MENKEVNLLLFLFHSALKKMKVAYLHTSIRLNKVKVMFLVHLPGQFFLSHFLFF